MNTLPNLNPSFKNMSMDVMKEIVATFQNVRLAEDQQALDKFVVAGRKVVYRQISDAYRVGLAICDRSNINTFADLLREYGMKTEASKVTEGKKVNLWSYVVAILYGDWVQQSSDSDGILVFERDKSATKYAHVLRYLHENKIKLNNVVAFIESYSTPHGNGMKGIEAADRAANPSKQKSETNSKVDSNLISRGESRDNDDVFEVDLPSTFHPAAQYGEALLKVSGSKLIIVGFNGIEPSDYEKRVAARGRAIVKAEKEAENSVQKQFDDQHADLAACLKSIQTDPTVRSLLLDDPARFEAMLTAATKALDKFQKVAGYKLNGRHTRCFDTRDVISPIEPTA